MHHITIIVMILAVSFASAQDGLYGSFLIGQKFVDFQPLNEELYKVGIQEKMFPNNNWTFGGEGHLIMKNRYILGGKAFGIMHERVLPKIGLEPQRRIRMTAGMGIATAGLNLFPPNQMGLHLYPQIGIGASSFMYQSKREFTDEEKMFDTVLLATKDNMETLGKMGCILDFSGNLEWYMPFKNFLIIIPGLDLGLLMHTEVGYSLLAGNLKWRRDFDMNGKDQVEGGPNLKFNGFYFNFGVGIGLTTPD